MQENINEKEIKEFNSNNNIISELINLIIKNNLAFDNDFPSIIEKSYNQLIILNNKNNSPKSNIENYKEDFIKNIKFLKNRKNNIKKKRKRSSKIKDNNSFNLNINSNNYNNCFEIENNDDKILNKSILKEDQINNSNKNNDIVQEIIKTNNSYSSKNNNSSSKQFNFSNDIKIKKHNKIIFTNKYNVVLKNNSIKKPSKNRNSIYRGVSKNGNKWQTIICFKKKVEYIGLYNTQEIAARVYDFISIKNRGIKAKTNFKYDIHQIKKISETNIDFNSKNINEIISMLIN